MKVSTEIGSATKIVGREKAIEMYAKAGFDAWDFSMFDAVRLNWQTREVIVDEFDPWNGANYVKYVHKLKQIGLDNGIVCNQSHAPFPCPPMLGYFKKAIECTAEAGGKICVIHPDNDKSAEENAEMYFDLLPFAKDHGVKIATENMWNWDYSEGVDHALPAACSNHVDFLAHLNAVNDDYLVACLDIGHSEMKGLNTSAVEMIQTLGKHVQALHIHDNDKWHDSHQIPFSMNIDFVKVAKALKEVGYQGYLTLEADAYLKKFNADNVFEGMKDLYASVKKFDSLFND